MHTPPQCFAPSWEDTGASALHSPNEAGRCSPEYFVRRRERRRRDLCEKFLQQQEWLRRMCLPHHHSSQGSRYSSVPVQRTAGSALCRRPASRPFREPKDEVYLQQIDECYRERELHLRSAR